MNDHEKFKALLKEAGLSREEFAGLIGIAYTSMNNQLAPTKELPKWAKSVLLIHDRIKTKYADVTISNNPQTGEIIISGPTEEIKHIRDKIYKKH